MDEAGVRAALTRADGEEGDPPLADADIAEILVEGGWAGVSLTRDGATRELLARLHGRIARAFPEAVAEVRCGTRVYRGGAGFGAGRHVIAVLGGKGGVGKSTLAVNLALTLSAMGLSVGLLDGDLHGPDIPHMLGIHPQRPVRGPGWRVMTPTLTPPSRRTRPQERYGLEVMSVGFVVPERMPSIIGGATMVSALLRFLVFDVAWTADIVVIDAPPGTGDELQVMAQELPLSGALFITTPQDLAQMDAERTLTLLTERDVPVVGLVQNMASLTCPHCENEIDMFGLSPRLTDAGVRVLGRIPFDVRLSVPADRGLPLVLGDPRGPIAYEFARIGSAVRRWLARLDEHSKASRLGA